MTFRAALLIAYVVLAFLMPGQSQAFAAERQVVLLFDERIELPGLSTLETEFSHTLRSGSSEPVDIYREAMDLSRFGFGSYKELLREFLRTKYSGKKIDVAVAVMAPAFDFLLENGDLIFPGAQIVFCGLDKSQLGARSVPSGVHGVLVAREFAPTLEIALRLHPMTERVVVVGGTSDFDSMILTAAKDELSAFEDRVSVQYLTGLSLRDMLTVVSHLPSRTLVLFTTMFRDGGDVPLIPHQVVGQVSAAANAPVYGFVDQYLGQGIVGGSLYGFARHGSETAQMVLRILGNDAVSEPPFAVSGSRIIFDWNQMKRWGISESSLPTGSQVYFRDPSLWETYRWQIILMCAVVLVQAALIGGLLHERRYRRLAEVESRQRLAELARVNRYSAAGELTTSIAHELNQPLGSILTNTEAAELMLKSASPDLDEIREILADIRRDDQRASEVIRRLRSMLKREPFEISEIDLNETVGEAVGFVSALAEGRDVMLKYVPASTALRIKGDPIQLQQVVLNLIMNAIDAVSESQSEKQKVIVATTVPGEYAEILVGDSGPGIAADHLKDVFDPFFTTKTHGMGMGLAIARTIVEAHHGQIVAENRNSGGAMFRIKLPLARQGQRRFASTFGSNEGRPPGIVPNGKLPP